MLRRAERELLSCLASARLMSMCVRACLPGRLERLLLLNPAATCLTCACMGARMLGQAEMHLLLDLVRACPIPLALPVVGGVVPFPAVS